jgi:hypothetical protein
MQQFFFPMHSCTSLDALQAELLRILVEFWSSQLCLRYTSLPPEVFSNLTGLPSPELLIPVPCLSTSSSDSSEFRSASSYALVIRTSTPVIPSSYEASKTFNPEIKQTLQMHNYNIHSQYKRNTHKTSIQDRIMQEKLLFVLTMANAYIFLQGAP